MVPNKGRGAGGVGFVFEAANFSFGHDAFEMDSRDAR